MTIAVRGSKSDIKVLHKRLVAFEQGGKVTMDYRTRALVELKEVVAGEVKTKSKDTSVDFSNF